MASVEQRETLNSISDTVDFFANFKTIDEDKDSDEESFHLPMLDCEDDINTNGKELHNGETEEEILNKFESSGTPDIVDSKAEESILNDDEEPHKDCDEIHKDEDEIHKVDDEINKVDDEINKVDDEINKVDDEINKVDDEINKVDDEINKVDDEINKDEDEIHKVDEPVLEGDDAVSKDDHLNNKNTDIVNETKDIVTSEISENITEENVSTMDSVEENECKEIKTNENDLSEKPIENKNSEISDLSNECPDENTLNNVKTDDSNEEISEKLDAEMLVNKEDEEKPASIESEKLDDQATENSSEKSPAPVETVTEEPCAETKDSSSIIDNDTVIDKVDADMDSDLIESDKAAIDIDIPNETETVEDMETEVDTTTTIKDTESDKQDNIVDTHDDDAMEIEEDSQSNIENTTNTADEKVDIDVSQQSNICDKSDKAVTEETVKIDDTIDEKDSEKVDNESNSEQASSISNKTEETKDEQLSETSKSTDIQEDSNKLDSSKDDNLACDDLLDISIIRDVDEDNAKAVAEVNDAQSSDKSDNDEQDDDKADNDIEESEADQEDNLGSSDKDDPMDFEDGTSSTLCIEDSSTNDIGNESTSDSVNKIAEKIVSQVSKNILNDDSNSSQKSTSDKPILETPEEPEEPAVYLDLDKHMAEQATLKDQNFPLHGKRSLSQDDIGSDLSSKKMKLSESPTSDNKDEIKTLLSFEKFMQSKKFRQKLTRSDLEQFCLQKICEAIMHRTEVGELHQTIKKQEQVIDSLRKDIQQLSKQTRDLDIVHKKLMNELKAQNGNKKPLAPLKITRSVGLQVKLSVAPDQNIKKKPNAPTTPGRTVTTPSTPMNRTRTIPPGNANVVRQVNTNSPRKPASPAVSQATTTTPILTQVLQAPGRPLTTTITNRVPIKPKPSEPQKPSGQGSGVIDLTDEDDKSSKATPVKILNKTLPLLGQGKLGNAIQIKNSKNKTNLGNKTVNGQGKVATPPVKTVQTTPKGSTPVRTVTTLPQGVRLTPTQVKNGIAIPASVVTSNSAGGTQLMYVVQPSQLVTTTAGGQQKTVLLNFQPGNSILTSTLNGSAVSVIPTKTTNTVQLKTVTTPVRKHPASLPSPPFIPCNALLKPVLPKPHLSIRKTDTGIILQWRMPYNLDLYEAIASYQLYAYQETNAPPSTDMWRKVGDVKALALPMACTLTQFADKNKYYFAVRSIDVHKRIGAFSDPEEISL